MNNLKLFHTSNPNRVHPSGTLLVFTDSEHPWSYERPTKQERKPEMTTELQAPKKRTRRRRRKEKGIDPLVAEQHRREEERSNLEILEFIQAVDRFKRKTLKVFPSWSEILEILRALGYSKVME
jgi:hypothetical protein